MVIAFSILYMSEDNDEPDQYSWYEQDKPYHISAPHYKIFYFEHTIRM